MEEIWKDIKDFEGCYQVSNLGRVRSLDRYIRQKNGHQYLQHGKIMSICYNKRTNVYVVYLSKEGKRKACAIHVLVANAFIANDDPINKVTVNHKDGDRSNNVWTNLEWATYSDNLQHAYDVLHRPINATSIRKRPCVARKKSDGQIIHFESVADASRGTHISETQIRRIANHECVNDKYEFFIT